MSRQLMTTRRQVASCSLGCSAKSTFDQRALRSTCSTSLRLLRTILERSRPVGAPKDTPDIRIAPERTGTLLSASGYEPRSTGRVTGAYQSLHSIGGPGGAKLQALHILLLVTLTRKTVVGAVCRKTWESVPSEPSVNALW